VSAREKGKNCGREPCNVSLVILGKEGGVKGGEKTPLLGRNARRRKNPETSKKNSRYPLSVMEFPEKEELLRVVRREGDQTRSLTHPKFYGVERREPGRQVHYSRKTWCGGGTTKKEAG